MEMIISWACNNNCRFCSEDEFKREAIEKGCLKRDFEAIYRNMVEFREKGYDHITFLGGEPTIHKDIIKIVASAKRLGFRTIFMTTNGRMLSRDKFAESIIAAGLNEVCISIHGTKETHEMMTRADGSYEQAIRALENLEGRIPIMTNSVITGDNMEDLPRLMTALNRFRLTRCAVAYPLLRGSMLNDGKIATYSEVMPYLRDIVSKSKHDIRISNIPMCILGDLDNHSDDIGYDERDYDNELGDDGKRYEDGVDEIRIDICKTCKHNKICRGIPREYIEMFSDKEFKGLKTRKR